MENYDYSGEWMKDEYLLSFIFLAYILTSIYYLIRVINISRRENFSSTEALIFTVLFPWYGYSLYQYELKQHLGQPVKSRKYEIISGITNVHITHTGILLFVMFVFVYRMTMTPSETMDLGGGRAAGVMVVLNGIKYFIPGFMYCCMGIFLPRLFLPKN
jgi:hypothetical protein